MATVSFHDKTPSATRLQSLWLAADPHFLRVQYWLLFSILVGAGIVLAVQTLVQYCEVSMRLK